MEGLFGFLIFLSVVVLVAGPVALIMALVLFNKLSDIERRVRQIEFLGPASAARPEKPKDNAVAAPTVIQKPIIPPTPPVVTPPPYTQKPAVPVPPSVVDKPVETLKPAPPAPTADIPVARPVIQKPVMPQPPKQPAVVPVAAFAAPVPEKPKTGLEQKIGITAALVVGVIVLIVGVGFFLKYVYENSMFSDLARVCLVAAGGVASLIVGEVIRRRDYGIVAKGLVALGFSLLYASIFSASRVYNLIDLGPALILALCVSAAAMAYAVCLNDRFTAFLSLLGGYLSPLIIVYHQDMPIPVFSYVLALSIGAMLGAMFRRWRAVNWIAMVGTWTLYTVWFEQFYAPSYMASPLTWIGIFGVVYLLQPILYGLVRKVAARAEDAGLLVINSIIVFYYLCRILYADYQQPMALAVAAFGGIHLLLMGAVIIRCREDRKLISFLGVLGTAMITTAIGVYFAEMPPKILGWAVEAVVLTFVGIRYKALTAKGMSFLVAAVSVVGLFYYLPLHAGEFRLILNGPFATWLFVSAALLVCHTLWRFMPGIDKEERCYVTQAFYVAGVLLLALGCTLEWQVWCAEYATKTQSSILMGMLVIASALLAVLSSRPLCPKGAFVQTVAAVVAVVGSVFAAMTVFGVYDGGFKIFLNWPFVLSCLFVVSLLWTVWQGRRDPDRGDFLKPLADTMMTLALLLLGILISEQIYMYWYCRSEYVQSTPNWLTLATHYLIITWTIYGLLMLAGGIAFKKVYVKALGVIAMLLAIGSLMFDFQLHKKADFNFIFNLPFIAWETVAAGMLIGHGLWRFMPQLEKKEREYGSQLFYCTGVLLLGLGCMLEWYAHCHWHITPADLGNMHFLTGGVLIFAVVLLTCFIRSLAPTGKLVHLVGLAVTFAGSLFALYTMDDVYYESFRIFANIPFMAVIVYAGAMLLSAACVRNINLGSWKLSPWTVLASLVLVWLLLSQQIYQFSYYHNLGENGIPTSGDWRFSAQMYISLSWAIYAAVLLLIGFFKRAAGVRYLSLAIFTILLGKINWDIQELPDEYRIATFVTTGLILVGVSVLYQFLKKKGFFDAIQDKKSEQLENNPVNPENSI